ncbi:hypothetical protein [Streptomyces sp. NPDC059909]|uniref:hypothetical protein n=1 Tax=Streptomyces sp. NPDC059909 TaxID=3346998 RepID=UPI0036521126
MYATTHTAADREEDERCPAADPVVQEPGTGVAEEAAGDDDREVAAGADDRQTALFVQVGRQPGEDGEVRSLRTDPDQQGQQRGAPQVAAEQRGESAPH